MIKHAADESVKKYKTISIARSFSQTEGVVYDETLDPVNPIHFHLYRPTHEQIADIFTNLTSWRMAP
jgi:hypothetical protein